MGSGFSNTSTTSPFAAMSSRPQVSKAADKAENLPVTSDDKFKASAFGSFANSTTSPFGGLAKPASDSPFSAMSGPKLSSFAGSAAPAPAAGGGFGALSSATKSAFGGSTFGSSLGGGFSSLGGIKTGAPSFATPGSLAITGLKSKPERAFGAPGDKSEDDDDSDEDNDNDDDAEKDTAEEERRPNSHLLSQRMSPFSTILPLLTCLQPPRLAKKARRLSGRVAQSSTLWMARAQNDRGKSVVPETLSSTSPSTSQRRRALSCVQTAHIACS